MGSNEHIDSRKIDIFLEVNVILKDVQGLLGTGPEKKGLGAHHGGEWKTKNLLNNFTEITWLRM